MLIETLLGHRDSELKTNYAQEFGNNWANLWNTLLLTRRGVGKLYQQQMHSWLEDKFIEKVGADGKVGYAPDWSQIVTEILTATGQTNENGAVNFILAHMGERVTEKQYGDWDFVPVTSRTTKLFLGQRTQCVQCHDHPFNGDWEQKHFWGINAFFRQTTASGRPGMAMQKKKGVDGLQFRVSDNKDMNGKGIVSFERRSGVVLFTDATYLDGSKINGEKQTGSRRAELARFVTTSPYFAKAFVNRTWEHFFGKSFTRDGCDDFGDHNKPTEHNGQLLEKLASDFVRHKHNPKDLIRWICNSRAYGLSSVANKTNDKVEDEVLFSRILLKAMSPEQLFESIMVASNPKVNQSKEARAEVREKWFEKLIANFGNDEGLEITYTGTVVQALLLMNGTDINKAIMEDKEGKVHEIMVRHRPYLPPSAMPGYVPSGATVASHRAAATELYKAALNRVPSTDELNGILVGRQGSKIPIWVLPKLQLDSRGNLTFDKINLRDAKVAQAFFSGFYQDMFWAMLNSNEFILNH
jgi:hypothetical protein